MIRHRKVTQEVDEVELVICDQCGKEFAPSDFETEEFHHIRFTGGYGSIFGDGVRVECDLCQHCLHDIIGDICRKQDDYDYVPA